MGNNSVRIELVKCYNMYQESISEMMYDYACANETIVPERVNTFRNAGWNTFKHHMNRTNQIGHETDSYVLFARDTSTGECVGSVQIYPELTHRLYLMQGNIKLGIRPSRRNMGYGKEFLKEVVKYLFTKTDISEIICCYDISNNSAQHMLLDLRAEYMGTYVTPERCIVRTRFAREDFV